MACGRRASPAIHGHDFDDLSCAKAATTHFNAISAMVLEGM
jgi:hypothetical protein